MLSEVLVTRDLLTADALFILECLHQRDQDGETTHLVDVRDALSPSVTLAFSDYLRFLRRFEYVILDRDEHTLALTELSLTELASSLHGRFSDQLGEFFAHKMNKPVAEVHAEGAERSAIDALGRETTRPPPPPPDAGFGVVEAGPRTRPPASRPSVRSVAPPRSSTPPPPPPPQPDPIYSRGDRVGAGPFGTVFRAQHTTLGVHVAIKEYSGPRIGRSRADVNARLKEAVGFQARLRHPAIVGVQDLDLTGSVPVAAVEYCEGGSLRDRIQGSATKLAPAVTLRIFAQLLDGLAQAHEAGFSHGDLKPENVVLDRRLNGKLCDLGLWAAGEPGAQPDVSNINYLPPERRQQGVGPAVPTADVYAMGVMLYEALVGRLPTRQAPFPSRLGQGIPAGLDWVIERMIAEAAGERYRDAGEALKDYLLALPQVGQPGRITVLTTQQGSESTAPVRRSASS